MRRYAHAENLKRKALDRRELDECWQKIPAEQKRDGKIAAAAAQCYLALGGIPQAQQIVEQALAMEWDSELVGLYAECEGPDTVRQIERADSGYVQRRSRRAVAARAASRGRNCVARAEFPRRRTRSSRFSAP